MRFLHALTLTLLASPIACSGSGSASGSGGTAGSGGAAGNGGSTTSSGMTGGGGNGSGGGGGDCAPAETNCDGVCVDLDKEPTSCGACGVSCGSGEACCDGACSTGCSLTITSASPPLGPMSGGTWITIKGQGFAAGARVHLGTSRAPARVVDPTTLLVLSPPGLAAKVAVRVDQGESHATRAEAFEYGVYGLEGTWQKVNMSSPRGNWPGISTLQDGRVLIAGGALGGMDYALSATGDLFNPDTSEIQQAAGPMSSSRVVQAQITLLTGKTLVLGRYNHLLAQVGVPFADLFDPQTNLFTPAGGQPSLEPFWPHAAMLADGRVLFVGYEAGTVGLYDPEVDVFSVAAGAPDCTGYRPTRLLDGRILLVKGDHAPVHIFDPDTGTFSDGGPGPTATSGDLYTLPDGRALYIAGSIETGDPLLPTAVLEIFDPAQSGFQPAPFQLAEARQKWLTTAMAGDGTILVLGGDVGDDMKSPTCTMDSFTLTSNVERIDPIGGTVTKFDSLPEKNFVMSAATTLAGSIVAAGGAPCGGGDAFPYFYFLKGTTPVPK